MSIWFCLTSHTNISHLIVQWITMHQKWQSICINEWRYCDEVIAMKNPVTTSSQVKNARNGITCHVFSLSLSPRFLSHSLPSKLSNACLCLLFNMNSFFYPSQIIFLCTCGYPTRYRTLVETFPSKTCWVRCSFLISRERSKPVSE